MTLLLDHPGTHPGPVPGHAGPGHAGLNQPGHAGLKLVNPGLRSEELLVSPFKANIDQTTQYEKSMVEIDWIDSDTS